MHSNIPGRPILFPPNSGIAQLLLLGKALTVSYDAVLGPECDQKRLLNMKRTFVIKAILITHDITTNKIAGYLGEITAHSVYAPRVQVHLNVHEPQNLNDQQKISKRKTFTSRILKEYSIRCTP